MSCQKHYHLVLALHRPILHTKTLVIILLVFLLNVTPYPLSAEQQTQSEINAISKLIDTYGKKTIARFILVLRRTHITIDVKGTLRDSMGLPGPAYVTPRSVLHDIQQEGMSVEQFGNWLHRAVEGAKERRLKARIDAEQEQARIVAKQRQARVEAKQRRARIEVKQQPAKRPAKQQKRGSFDEAIAKECPRNFLEILEGRDDTNLYKKHIVSLCYGKRIIIKGKVINIDSKHDYKGNLKGYELNINSLPDDRWYQVAMKKKHGCDLLSIKKGSIITIEAKLTKFKGYGNHYLTAIDGVCK